MAALSRSPIANAGSMRRREWQAPGGEVGPAYIAQRLAALLGGHPSSPGSSASTRPPGELDSTPRGTLDEGGWRSPSKGKSAVTDFLSEYQLGEKIGQGGYAVVYCAQRRALPDEVNDVPADFAVKVTCLAEKQQGMSSLCKNKSKCKMAAQEVQMLKAVSGLQGCIRLIDAFEEDMFSYVVLERCEMSLLVTLQRFTRYDEVSIKQVLKQQARAIEALHVRGICHRDIKPDNFLCTGEGYIKLCDFGLAQSIGSGNGGVLKLSCGTAPFMSPEMLSGTGYGLKTDVWSLGVLAYVLAHGHLPYSANGDKAMTKQAIMTGDILPSFAPDERLASRGCLPTPSFSSLVRRLLCRDPDLRLTAASTLRTFWLAAPSSQETFPSMKGTLEAARQTGVFAVPGCDWNAHAEWESELLRRATDAQELRHRP